MRTPARDLATIAELDLVGLHEIGVRLDVASNTANVWRNRGIFPPPALELAMGPIWVWADVEDWARKTGRLPRPNAKKGPDHQ